MEPSKELAEPLGSAEPKLKNTELFARTFYSTLTYCLFRGEFDSDHILLRIFVLPSFVGTPDASQC